jgi:hypothetical protein
MATIEKRGQFWRVKTRRAGLPAQTRTFDKRTQAQQWASSVESDLDKGIVGLQPGGMDEKAGDRAVGRWPAPVRRCGISVPLLSVTNGPTMSIPGSIPVTDIRPSSESLAPNCPGNGAASS